MPYTPEQKMELVQKVDGLKANGKSLTAACKEAKISPSSYRSWKALPDLDAPLRHQIFISHRHEDRILADALRRQLLGWGFAEDQVFQSSSERGGTEIGAPLRTSIQQKISRAQLVILIFTYERHDWQYCMWEMGVAMGADRKKRKVIALRAFDDKPKVFVADKDIKIDWRDIQSFVKQVHKDDEFFPGLPAYQPTIAAEASKDRSQNLYNALMDAQKEVIIKPSPLPTRRCGSITFRVDASKVKEIESLDGSDTRKIREALETAAVIAKADAEGLEHFGFKDPNRELGKDIRYLVRRWKTKVKSSDDWATDLILNLYNAIQNDSSDPCWRPFPSAAQKSTWVVPLVKLVRTVDHGDQELDVDVYKVPAPGGGVADPVG